MSTEEKNKALVCCFLEAQSTGDLEALDKLLAPDFVAQGLLSGEDSGRGGFMQGVAEAHAALSHIRTIIESTMFKTITVPDSHATRRHLLEGGVPSGNSRIR
jgi:ketosteroid isomerase-like protein